ncbi:conserved hypothetical protein [Syntrophobacter sp. SbD1]|nr:conserved hypothetical protein [Syntrophobacter sp. SbD1]
MGKRKFAGTVPSIKCFINTGSNLLALDAGSEGLPPSGETLPGRLAAGASPLTYGQYMGSVVRLLSENSFKVLRKLLKKQLKPTPKLENASSIQLIAEKHGALYSVSRLRMQFDDDARSFAVNCAFSPEQQAFLKVEVKLLSNLHARFGLQYLPLPFVSESAPDLMLFIAEWFENYHEFHLSSDTSGIPAINVWRQDGKTHFLDSEKTAELYAQASKILTSCLDSGSFSQIFPWHHAAGDFIVDDSQSPPGVRLITVRGYRTLLARKAHCKDKMLGSLHFFVNLGMRMRLDRLDGTGELAWAGPRCLSGVIRGFVEAWESRRKNSDLPKAGDIFSLFLGFSPEERLAFAKVVAADGQVEADEGGFLFARLPGHIMELSDALENFKS